MIVSPHACSQEQRDLFEVIERVLDKGIVVDAGHRLDVISPRESEGNDPLVVTQVGTVSD